MYDSLMMGAEYFETDPAREVPVGIGGGSIIRKTILDKNTRVGREVRIENRAGTRASRRRQLLHPRGDRDRPQERRHSRRDCHLAAG